MSDTDQIVLDSTKRLFLDLFPPDRASHRDEAVWPEEAWGQIEELGLPLALVAEEQGGFALGHGALHGILRLVGQIAVPLPIAETMLAAKLLSEAGLEVPPGPLSIAAAPGGGPLRVSPEGAGLRLTGTLPRVPWGRQAGGIALVADGPEAPRLMLLRPDHFRATPGTNMAGEPRDDLALDTLVPGTDIAATSLSAHDLKGHGAALRAMALAGAIGRVLEMSVAYANERVQFGRPIGKFQAIQQNLAVMAGEAAAAEGAAGLAAAAFLGEIDTLAIAAAKQRTSEAAGIVAGIAHQVHGAIGFTHEHALHVHTRRLWAWRDEFGNEAFWSRRLGDHVAKLGPDGLWPFLATL